MTFHKTIRWALLGAIVFNATACTMALFRKFDRQRYETLYHGQADFEVEKTMGKPHRVEGNQWTYIHDNPDYHAVITFDENDELINKTWALDPPPEEVTPPQD
jgi:hypothetical protein